MARGKRPVTFRTRKLSLSAPMVLPWRRGGRVGRRRTTITERGSEPRALAPVRVCVRYCSRRPADERRQSKRYSEVMTSPRRGSDGARDDRGSGAGRGFAGKGRTGGPRGGAAGRGGSGTGSGGPRRAGGGYPRGGSSGRDESRPGREQEREAQGGRPSGDRPQWQDRRPQGDRPSGGRPQRPASGRSERPTGDRPQWQDRRPQGDRPSGARP